jgi:uncharacterized protein
LRSEPLNTALSPRDEATGFLPESVQRKVWAFFDRASVEYGRKWPVHYRLPVDERLAVLRGLGVTVFAPLVYPHKPGMASWLNDWVQDFAANTPGAVPTATFYPEPSVESYMDDALRKGIRCVKVHVQVGAFDPRTPSLDKVWGMLADAGVASVVHCGHGPLPGEFTGLDLFAEVLARHPRLIAVLAHSGMPEIGRALDLVERFPGVYLDAAVVGGVVHGVFRPIAARLGGPAGRSCRSDRVRLGFPVDPVRLFRAGGRGVALGGCRRAARARFPAGCVARHTRAVTGPARSLRANAVTEQGRAHLG